MDWARGVWQNESERDEKVCLKKKNKMQGTAENNDEKEKLW